MSERVTMPALGESVTEGTVTRWLKGVGHTVEVDEPLLEVSTDKVDTEVPSPVAGTIEEILVEEDETVPVGSDLVVIGDGSGSTSKSSGGGAAESEKSDAQGGTADDSAAEQATDAAGPVPSAEAEPDERNSDAEQESSDAKAKAASGSAGSSGSSGSGGQSGGTEVTMPALGESVTEGTVTRWLKAEGDTVEVDEPLLEVSTDKVDTEVPSPVAGVVSKILVQEDETVEVGAPLAVVGGEASSGDSERSDDSAEQKPAKDDAAEAPSEKQSEKKSDETSDDQGGSGDNSPAQAKDEQSSKDDSADGPAAQAPAPAQTQSEQASSGQGDASGSGSGSDAGIYVTPLVRKLAAQHDVDLSSLKGTGVGGRIRKQDVLDAAEAAKQPAASEQQAPASSSGSAAASESAPSSAPSAPSSALAAASTSSPSISAGKRGSREKMSRLRKVIATRMVESLQVSAQLTTVVEVDMTKVARLRAKAKSSFEQREGVKLSFLPFIALATVDALKAHPNVNASVEGDEIVYHGQENLSIAVDTEKGLIVPVVKNAGDLNIAGLARAIAEIADRTRSNKITPDDLSGGTFTITNTGSRGALFDTPIINQPQVGILGTGAIVKRPVVVEADGGETIAVRSMMYLALSYDHRIVDGADAARFLATIKERLEGGQFENALG